MIWRCDLVPQYQAYKEEIDRAVLGVLASGRYTLGQEVAAFEREFAAYLGCRRGVGVNSGTDALMLALWCLRLRPGDEVITTPFTAIPTYAAIKHVGARPVFVDVEEDTFLIDLEQVAAALTSRTRAVVPVHLFGNAVDVERLRGIVGPGVAILEDAAQAHGATVRGRKVGGLGDLGAFSFYPTKNLGGYGDGGMVMTDSDELAETLRRRRMYGMVNKDECVEDGINSRLDELQAAILRVKLRYLEAMNRRRQELDVLYRQQLPPQVRPQAVRPGTESVYHVYSVLCDGRRDELVAALEREQIQTNVYYPMPLPRQVAYRVAFGEHPPLPIAEEVCRQVLALPFYPEMSAEVVTLVTDRIADFYRAKSV